jgi:uncharacterized membrane protein YkoI
MLGMVAAVALVGTAVIGVALIGGAASAGQGGVLDDGKELLPKAGISLDRAIVAAQTAATGAVGEVDLEYWNDALVFNVDVGDSDVKVDAATGAVLGVTQDD